jgi:hypothetical protein
VNLDIVDKESLLKNKLVGNLSRYIDYVGYGVSDKDEDKNVANENDASAANVHTTNSATSMTSTNEATFLI